MEKYGYEQKDRKSSNEKVATEEVLCPICNTPSSGSPPVCPRHGSVPFEKMDKKK